MRDQSNSRARGFVRVIIAVIVVVTAMPSYAQTYTTLVNFDWTNGLSPYYGPLVQGRDGNLWGTTAGGGAYNSGTIFKMTPSGTLTTVYSFCAQTDCTDGATPVAGLVLGKDGKFYGTTSAGGDINSCNFPAGCGVIFKVTPKGVYTVLHEFTASNGAAGPVSGLVQGTSGKFYGIGGLDGGETEFYSITSSGTYTALADWAISDGGHPYGGLIQATDGWFYGTTYLGGTGTSCNDGCGTVFKIQANGKNMTTLHSFNVTDGAALYAGLVQGADGNFYGATAYGGSNENNCVFVYPYSTCGTLFELSSTKPWPLTTLYNFCPQSGCPDGVGPYGTPIQATDGNFYGTTDFGAASNGSIYEWDPTTQAFSVLYDFPYNSSSLAGLVQATNGKFYGTNASGGDSTNCAYGCGAIFSLDIGLGPFVRPVTYYGTVGSTVEILGQGFSKSATTVSFSGTSATSTVVSANYLTAKVPTGATTGSITVTTGRTTLTSDKIFTVPQ